MRLRQEEQPGWLDRKMCQEDDAGGWGIILIILLRIEQDGKAWWWGWILSKEN